MPQFEEKTYISEFNILKNGCINVQKTTEILKDGAIISKNYWRIALHPNDPITDEVLSETYYLNLARQAWTAEVVEEFNNYMENYDK